MTDRLDRWLRLPPNAASSGRARAMLRREMSNASLSADGDDELADTVLLLASELCDNATLHAGTEFEVELSIRPDEIMVAVTDHGAGPLELHLSRPRPKFGRAASHGRGLMLVEQLATSWGTRHDRDGTHRIWFSIARGEPSAATRNGTPQAIELPSLVAEWPDTEQVRQLLHVPTSLGLRLEMPVLVAELIRRLREVLGAEGVSVDVDHGDGSGAFSLAHDGADPSALPGTPFVEVGLPLTSPLRGVLRILPAAGTESTASVNTEIAELTAQRIALAVEKDWLRDADLRRRAWMAYLADASELFGQSMEVPLVVALVPQVVVPRLGQWCAVLLLDETSQLRLSALTHADDETIPDLRAALDPTPPADLRHQLDEILDGSAAPGWFSEPTDGVAVGLTARAQPIGVLLVGRPAGRSHTPEDVALIGDIARRASLAIDNAQTTAAHIATSQALQQALLPRALPREPGIEFAAEYLPASAGSDVGGDFYDVLTLSPQQWLASIGDVCGKGARAAARTGMVRDVLRVLIREGSSLTRAIEILNEVMMDAADPSQFCTLAAALISRPPPGEPPGLTVELILAGHPRAVLARSDGTAEFIGSYGTAVGLTSQLKLVATQHRLYAGDTLLAYTDGVTERRRGREQFGSERLLSAASATAGGEGRHVIASVRSAVEAFSSGPRRDDIALLAVRASP
ncbi:SpoIIE family protein phosphatase [Pseudonocardia spinosispora]|uniref:SpoIIE family protein phosphatase n=1 Tax=Pseudonocardia spinosispora TaxID=103441 RepID=UPI00048E362B|nr:SpoIIE family protein phosphatase [Pseudonocardia spinosispora]